MFRILALRPDERLEPLLGLLRDRGLQVDRDWEGEACLSAYDVVLLSPEESSPPPPDDGGPLRVQTAGCAGDPGRWAALIEQMAGERRRMRLLTRILETSPDLEAWLGPDGRVKYISPSCEDLTGYPASANLADPSLLVRCCHPDDRDRLRESLFGGGHVARTFCCRIVTSQGETRRIVHRSIPCQDQDGRPIGVRLHQHRAPDGDRDGEVRRLRALLGQIEGERALLTAVLESLPVGVIATGASGELLVANPAAIPYLEQIHGPPLPVEAYTGHYRELERQVHDPDGCPAVPPPLGRAARPDRTPDLRRRRGAPGHHADQDPGTGPAARTGRGQTAGLEARGREGGPRSPPRDARDARVQGTEGTERGAGGGRTGTPLPGRVGLFLSPGGVA